MTGNNLNLSESSLNNVGKSGVSKASAKKIVSYFESNSSHSLEILLKELNSDGRIKAFEEMKAPASEWLYCLNPFEEAVKSYFDLIPVPILPIQYPLSFIKNRIAKQYELSEALKEKFTHKQEALTKEDAIVIIEMMGSLLRDSSNIPNEIVDDFISCSLDPELANTKNETLNSFLLYSQFDFYLELIANIDLGINELAELIEQQSPIKNIVRDKLCLDLLGNAIETYYSSEDNSVHSCFDGLLHCMKDDLSIKAKAVNESQDKGWRELASLINIDSDSSESLSDVHYNQIKKWRKGEDKPSGKKLKAFISNYLEYIDKKEDKLLGVYFHLIKILDHLGGEILDGAPNQEKAMLHIKEVLSQYPIYYKKCQEGELN